jgi:hypothetical protein
MKIVSNRVNNEAILAIKNTTMVVTWRTATNVYSK